MSAQPSSTTSDDLSARSATELAAGVRRGDYRPAEVVQAFLDRIERLEPSIRAFEVVRADAALQEARALESHPKLNELPLAGVPVAIKDNIDVAGNPTRHGSAATAPDAAGADDELVRRLRQAGAIVIGKTRMPELAVWPFTEAESAEPTRNPWNLSRSPGGSTGGGGAAVAARLAPLALGSDGGGSIRVPAACCGVVGLRPGPGVVPLAGGAQTHWGGMTEFGPLANTVSDAALMLEVLAGTPEVERLPDGVAGLRIAVSTKHPTAGARVSGEVAAAVERTADLLAGAGCTVTHADPPYPVSLGWRFSRRWLPGIAADVASLTRGPGGLEPRTRKMARAGRFLRRLHLDAPASADSLKSRMDRWFEHFDVLLMPTIASTAVPIGTWQGRGWIRTTLGVANWLLTTPWNLVRYPAMSVPAGLAGDGLPLAVQLVAVPGAESKLLAVAGEIERARPWPACDDATFEPVDCLDASGNR